MGTKLLLKLAILCSKCTYWIVCYPLYNLRFRLWVFVNDIQLHNIMVPFLPVLQVKLYNTSEKKLKYPLKPY